MKLPEDELLGDAVIDGKKLEHAINKLGLLEGKTRVIRFEFKQDEDGERYLFMTSSSQGIVGNVEIPVDEYSTWNTRTKAGIAASSASAFFANLPENAKISLKLYTDRLEASYSFPNSSSKHDHFVFQIASPSFILEEPKQKN